MLSPGQTIGIIGGGQLGRMSAIAAARLGFRAVVFSDSTDCPAAQVANLTIVGDYESRTDLSAFAEKVDVITFEFENISTTGLGYLQSIKPIHPSPDILRISQNRISEKNCIESLGFKVAPWLEIKRFEDLTEATEILGGFPFILKTTRLGYDGKGQALVTDFNSCKAAFAELLPHPLIAEKKIDFTCEISVIVARNLDRNISCFDVTENQHYNGILDISIAPARIVSELSLSAKNIARHIAEHLNLVGIMAVEMFVDNHGSLLVNEIAPRPHNSGHWTMDACLHDQFEMHIRAISGLPLPVCERYADAIMKNLVGPKAMEYWPQILAERNFIPYLYGKNFAKPGRKMGHVNYLFSKNSLPGDLGIQDALQFLSRPLDR